MNYKRCPRCELNYILQEQSYCALCRRELAGQYDGDDDDALYDVCPYCEKNNLSYGQSRCTACEARLKHDADGD